MAGTINLALSQQFDMDGEPLSGGLLYFFVAATSTPQSAFQDVGLTIPHPNPIVLDASGRVPMFYLADGNIKIRLADKAGVTVIAADNLLVIGPSAGGGGGGGGVDPTTQLATGDIKARYGTGVLDGFVRCNGNTIGNTGSSATELASTDLARPLFEYLYPFTNLVVTPARTGNATNDFNNGARLALPDLRGRTIAGMDDMGATAAGRLTAAFFGASAIVLGNAGGAEKQTLTSVNQLPAHLHQVISQHFGGNLSVGLADTDHSHRILGGTGFASSAGYNLDHAHPYTAPIENRTGGPSGNVTSSGSSTTGLASAAGYNLDHVHGIDFQSQGMNVNHAHAISGNTQNAGNSSAAYPVANPAMVLTFYIKL